MPLLQFDGMVRNGVQAPGDEDERLSTSDAITTSGGQIVDPEDCDADGALSLSQRQKIRELLGAW